jgi:hypothetical protein
MLNTTVINSLEEVFDEEVIGPIDGVNTTFNTVHNFDPSSLKVYLNGLSQRRGVANDFIIVSNNEISMNEPPLSGDSISVDYIKE